MSMKLSTLNEAIKNAGGKFGAVSGYVNRDGIKSNAMLRIGETYGSELKRALSESLDDFEPIVDEFDSRERNRILRSDWCKKYRATVEEFEDGFKEQRESWQRSIDGKQPIRKKNTVSVAETLGAVEVAQISACGRFLNIRCNVRKVEYDEASIKNAAPKKEPKSGKARIKDALRTRYTKNRTYSLGFRLGVNWQQPKIGPVNYTLDNDNGPVQVPTFKRLDFSGFSVTPEDIVSILKELRQTA